MGLATNAWKGKIADAEKNREHSGFEGESAFFLDSRIDIVYQLAEFELYYPAVVSPTEIFRPISEAECFN